jgi:hypothetical protein
MFCPLPIVFEFQSDGLQQITKIELLPRQGCVGVSAPKKFYLEISSDGKDWTRVGSLYEDKKPDGLDKRIFENLKISLAAAVEPTGKITTMWGNIKAGY